MVLSQRSQRFEHPSTPLRGFDKKHTCTLQDHRFPWSSPKRYVQLQEAQQLTATRSEASKQTRVLVT